MLKFIKYLFIIVLFSIVGIMDVHAATIDAKTCSQTDVQAAIDSASDGDTVVVPAGNCTWMTPVKIGKTIWTKPVTYESKQVTVRGAGINKTIVTIGDVNTPNNTAFSIKTVEGKGVRITGFTFSLGVPTTDKNNKTLIGLTGTSKKWRIDHNRFEHYPGRAIVIGGYTFGVIDHNTFYKGGSAIYISHSAWNGKKFGDGSWNSPLALGTEKAVYIEDNVFETADRTSVDAGSGARYVFRYNTSNKTVINHGTETSGRYRSAFSFEVYNNTFTNTEHWWSVMHFRGGTGVIFNNTARGYGWGNGEMVHVANYRDSDNYKFWGQCDGTSPYDKNVKKDDVPYVYESGTSADNNSVGVLTVSGESWGANQWVGYSVHNTTTGESSVITANTADTITAQRGTRGSGNYVDWAVGDSFIILRAYPCLDQVGWSTGNLLSNYDPPLPKEWPQQVLAPLYGWGNTLDGKYGAIKSRSPHIKENRDFYNVPDSSVGLLSDRPVTCTPYEAYWATDQGGDWDKTNTTSNDGMLYKCTSTDTWTAYYTPYTYPHPLTVNNPPGNLRFE